MSREAVPLRSAGTRPARHGAHSAAREEDLDRDAVTGAYTPTFAAARAELLDHADRLVPGHEREPGEELSGELLVVGAAQPTRLDPQQAVVVADLRERERARVEPRAAARALGRARRRRFVTCATSCERRHSSRRDERPRALPLGRERDVEEQRVVRGGGRGPASRPGARRRAPPGSTPPGCRRGSR